MHHIRLLAAAVVIALTPSIARAQAYEFLANIDGTGYLINRESMRRSGSKVALWFEERYRVPSPTGATFSRNLAVFNCDEMSYKTLAALYYKPDGSPSSSYGEQPVKYSPPGSVFYGFIEKVCSI